MADEALLIDVVHPRLRAADVAEGEVVVVVEPLYGGVAVAAALDAGWESVELGDDSAAGAPIPLVSFEQRPATGQRRCRVRAGDLLLAVRAGDLLGAPAYARPLCSRLAAGNAARVTFVPVVAGEELGSDAWWACGMLARVLLDELDRPGELSDAAGLAVTLAQGAEDPFAQLSAGARWQRHIERGGHPDDLRVAAAVDSIAVVPVMAVEEAGDRPLVARAWTAEMH